MKLKGSDKQIKWAEDILNPLFDLLETGKQLKPEDYGEEGKGKLRKENADQAWGQVIEELSKEDAGMIIENRHKLEVDELGVSPWFREFMMDYMGKKGIKKYGFRTLDLLRGTK